MFRLSVPKLKFLIASIILLFFIQEVVIRIFNISEPYPALRMPPFTGNSLNEDGFYQTNNVAIQIDFEGEGQLILTPNEFFYNAPNSHLWSLMGKFKPANKSEKALAYNQIQVLEPVIPGFFISRKRSLYEIQQHPETVQWLQKQVQRLSPEKSPEKVSFYWYQGLYNPANLFDNQSILTDTTIISLKNG